ncbi:N-acetylmuramoyl-L-alanine amidase [Rhizobium johnstonii]|nr:N-acetylmuramoyl-L-alanine amidase [Rhizobium johnstonii]
MSIEDFAVDYDTTIEALGKVAERLETGISSEEHASLMGAQDFLEQQRQLIIADAYKGVAGRLAVAATRLEGALAQAGSLPADAYMAKIANIVSQLTNPGKWSVVGPLASGDQTIAKQPQTGNGASGTPDTSKWNELVDVYKAYGEVTDTLKAASLAQWIVESRRGQSDLARMYQNYGGLKYKDRMAKYATSVQYMGSDGKPANYCSFLSSPAFIIGYWQFIRSGPAYVKWQDFANDSEAYIHYIADSYAEDPQYAVKVIACLDEARSLLRPTPSPGTTSSDTSSMAAAKPAGTGEPFQKPSIARFVQSPNFSSRNGERIRRLILHCTTSRNVEGTIAWFSDPISQVSAHYIVARDGSIYQMVRDSDKAWHAKGANIDSIGIEHSAAPDDHLTTEQERSSIALIKWLLSEYKLTKTSIHGHRFTSENAGTTDCPDHIFGDNSEDAVTNWVNANF